MEVVSRKEQHNVNKLHKRLRRLVGTAIADFNMIEPGDRVMVCLRGKDSLRAARYCQFARPRAITFELVAGIGSENKVFPKCIDEISHRYRYALPLVNRTLIAS